MLVGVDCLGREALGLVQGRAETDDSYLIYFRDPDIWPREEKFEKRSQRWYAEEIPGKS